MKIDIKNKIKSVIIGGLVISSPLAGAFAADLNTTPSVEDLVNQTNMNDNLINTTPTLYQDENIKIDIGSLNQFNLKNNSIDDNRFLFSNYGAQIRVAQLDRRLKIQIENANLIIQAAEDKGYNVSYQELEAIVADLTDLQISIEELDLDNAQADELRDLFIETKIEAQELSKTFMNIVKDIFTDDEKKALRERINLEIKNKLKEKNENIEKYVKKYNQEKINSYSSMLNISKNVIAKVETGEINGNEVKKLLEKEFEKLKQEDKDNFKSKVGQLREEEKERIEKIREEQKAREEKLREELKKRFENIREEQKGNLERLREEEKEIFKKTIEEQRDNLERLREEEKERIEKIR